MSGDVISLIAKWSRNQPLLDSINSVNGGWERWAQLEILLGLRNQKIEAIDEDNCFSNNTSLRCDLSINWKNDGTFWDIVELKCWKHNSDELSKIFTEVEADVRKLIDNEVDNYHSGQGKTTRKHAIGLLDKQNLKHWIGSNDADIPVPKDDGELVGYLEKKHPGFEYKGTQQKFTHYAPLHSTLIISSWTV